MQQIIIDAIETEMNALINSEPSNPITKEEALSIMLDDSADDSEIYKPSDIITYANLKNLTI